MKFVIFPQDFGGVMTFVDWYSSFVLKAVMTQETIGRTAWKEKKTRVKYLNIVQMMVPTV